MINSWTRHHSRSDPHCVKANRQSPQRANQIATSNDNNTENEGTTMTIIEKQKRSNTLPAWDFRYQKDGFAGLLEPDRIDRRRFIVHARDGNAYEFPREHPRAAFSGPYVTRSEYDRRTIYKDLPFAVSTEKLSALLNLAGLNDQFNEIERRGCDLLDFANMQVRYLTEVYRRYGLIFRAWSTGMPPMDEKIDYPALGLRFGDEENGGSRIYCCRCPLPARHGAYFLLSKSINDILRRYTGHRIDAVTVAVWLDDPELVCSQAMQRRHRDLEQTICPYGERILWPGEENPKLQAGWLADMNLSVALNIAEGETNSIPPHVLDAAWRWLSRVSDSDPRLSREINLRLGTPALRDAIIRKAGVVGAHGELVRHRGEAIGGPLTTRWASGLVRSHGLGEVLRLAVESTAHSRLEGVAADADRIYLQVPRGDVTGTVEEVLHRMTRFIGYEYPGLDARFAWEVVGR